MDYVHKCAATRGATSRPATVWLVVAWLGSRPTEGDGGRGRGIPEKGVSSRRWSPHISKSIQGQSLGMLLQGEAMRKTWRSYRSPYGCAISHGRALVGAGCPGFVEPASKAVSFGRIGSEIFEALD